MEKINHSDIVSGDKHITKIKLEDIIPIELKSLKIGHLEQLQNQLNNLIDVYKDSSEDEIEDKIAIIFSKIKEKTSMFLGNTDHNSGIEYIQEEQEIIKTLNERINNAKLVIGNELASKELIEEELLRINVMLNENEPKSKQGKKLKTKLTSQRDYLQNLLDNLSIKITRQAI